MRMVSSEVPSLLVLDSILKLKFMISNQINLASLSEVVNQSDFIFVSVYTPMNKKKNGVMDTRIIDSVFDEVVSRE